MADRCEIQLSYAIGVADPTSIMVETFGTEKVSHDIIIEAVRQFFDLRPYGLQEMLNLLQPIYKKTAAYGHFGREEFPWEATDKAELYAISLASSNRATQNQQSPRLMAGLFVSNIPPSPLPNKNSAIICKFPITANS